LIYQGHAAEDGMAGTLGSELGKEPRVIKCPD
jgi:hypothetical protein